MDTTGEGRLASIVQDFSKQGIVLISGIKPQPKSVLHKTGLYEVIGEENFFEHTGDAIDYALTQINNNKCLGCRHFAFKECQALSGIQGKVVKSRGISMS